jgi:hypothetical protein
MPTGDPLDETAVFWDPCQGIPPIEIRVQMDFFAGQLAVLAIASIVLLIAN